MPFFRCINPNCDRASIGNNALQEDDDDYALCWYCFEPMEKVHDSRNALNLGDDFFEEESKPEGENTITIGQKPRKRFLTLVEYKEIIDDNSPVIPVKSGQESPEISPPSPRQPPTMGRKRSPGLVAPINIGNGNGNNGNGNNGNVGNNDNVGNVGNNDNTPNRQRGRGIDQGSLQKERHSLRTRIAERVRFWADHVDNYNALIKHKNKPCQVWRAEPTIDFHDALGSIGVACLHRDAVEGQKTVRLRFFQQLAQQLEMNSYKSPISLHSETVHLEEFLGSKSLFELYKQAIEEERNSVAFRDAVLLAGMTNYAGLVRSWTAPKHIILAGASGTGKTHGAKNIIRALNMLSNELKDALKDSKNKTPIRYIVAVDGGDARAISQVRKIVLQCALAFGYKGIQDLHSHSSRLEIKHYIKEAAFALNRVHVVEPRTFVSLDESYRKVVVKREQTIYCRLYAPPNVVQVQGDSRAWYDHFKPNNQFTVEKIELNNASVGCESKEYSSSGFKIGTFFSKTSGGLYTLFSNLRSSTFMYVNMDSLATVTDNKIDYSPGSDMTLEYCSGKKGSQTVTFNLKIEGNGDIKRL